MTTNRFILENRPPRLRFFGPALPGLRGRGVVVVLRRQQLGTPLNGMLTMLSMSSLAKHATVR
jgi:hypothetical protein